MKKIARSGLLFFIIGCFGAFSSDQSILQETLSYLSMILGSIMFINGD